MAKTAKLVIYNCYNRSTIGLSTPAIAGPIKNKGYGPDNVVADPVLGAYSIMTHASDSPRLNEIFIFFFQSHPYLYHTKHQHMHCLLYTSDAADESRYV